MHTAFFGLAESDAFDTPIQEFVCVSGVCFLAEKYPYPPLQLALDSLTNPDRKTGI